MEAVVRGRAAMEALAAAAEGGPFAAAVVVAAAGGPPCRYDMPPQETRPQPHPSQPFRACHASSAAARRCKGTSPTAMMLA